MKSSKKHILFMLISVISLMSITACTNMSKRDKNTAIGAGIGAVGVVLILTQGSGLGTVGGVLLLVV